MVTDLPGRRERKRNATHELLRSVALHLGAEFGLHNVTVEQIAEKADVSVRTFYDHFPSKEDAVIGFDASRVDQLREALNARPLNEPPRVALQTVLRQLLEQSANEWPLRMKSIRANPGLLPRMFASFVVYERAMIEGIASRTGLDPDLDLYPTLVTAVASAAFRSSIGIWRANGESTDLSAIFDAAFRDINDGLLVPDKVARTAHVGVVKGKSRK
jgi:AcrR family transcriptional regulator